MMRSKTKRYLKLKAGLFGTAVAAMVLEVTDNKTLLPEKRKSAERRLA
jgi:hypothetical protein